MTKEELIKEMKALKQERMEDIMKINAKRDTLLEFVANLSHLIDEAEKE